MNISSYCKQFTRNKRNIYYQSIKINVFRYVLRIILLTDLMFLSLLKNIYIKSFQGLFRCHLKKEKNTLI